MALAAYNVMKAHNRTNILIGGCRRHAAGDRRRAATAACSPPCAIRPAASMAARSSPASRRSSAGEKTGQRGIPEEHRHRRPGGHQGERARHAVDGRSLPDLSVRCRERQRPRRSDVAGAAGTASGISQVLRRRRGAARRRLRAARRRDPRPGRRERRRQVDADEDHRRRARRLSTAACGSTASRCTSARRATRWPPASAWCTRS